MDSCDAGEFGLWLDDFKAATGVGGGVEVPCGGCTACCCSGQLIPVADDDCDALAHIPAQDLTRMSGSSGGYFLRHDEAGRCSQLKDDRCTIYEHRPSACRTYDCRIFSAAGVRPDKPLIAEAALRWRFSHASEQSRRRHADVQTAAVVIGFPGGLTAPASPTQHALAAIDGADAL